MHGAECAALKAGSGAAKACEPRQGWKAATVSSHFWVTPGRLAGASDSAHDGTPASTRGARPFFISQDSNESCARSVRTFQPASIALGSAPLPGRNYIESAHRVRARSAALVCRSTRCANSISTMKSDHAIPPSGIQRRNVPPAPPTRPLVPARPSVPRPAVPSAPPRAGRRYLAPAPLPARTRSWATALAFPYDGGLFLLMLVLATVAAMAFFFIGSQRRITVRINAQETVLWTRQQTVSSALTEAGITWNPEDIVRPALDQALPTDGKISIRLAIPLIISVDGNTLERRTQKTTIREVLAENGITLKPLDQVFAEGRLMRPDALLPQATETVGAPAALAPQTSPLHLTVTRALPITINDNGTISTLFTTENTLGTALTRAGVQIYAGDSVSPDLTTPVSSGASVFIRRSRPAEISVDGRTIRTRTRTSTVAALLAQEGIKLEGKDYAEPAPTTPVIDYTRVSITRVREEFITETEQLAFQTKWLPDPNLELDQRVVSQTGNKGLKNRLFKSVYENGKLISTGLEREWIAQPPQDHIINYGTKVILRDLTLPDGSVVQYWRKIRLLATAYTAATSGKTKDQPEYGRTRLGLQAGRGVVATDPRVINLGANVFVPGYGVALAGDTGGRIKGRRIDLGFAENQLEDWYRWVDVYLLAPAPPKSQLNILLPDYPSERTRGR